MIGSSKRILKEDLDSFGPMFNPAEDEEATERDEIVVTGERLERLPTAVQVTIGDVGGPSGDTGSGGGGSGEGPHLHVDTNRVGDTSCDADEAWQGLLLNAAPGQQSAASTGMIVDVPGLGPVVQTVNWETMTVTNTTMPGHLLHPGEVTRQIIGIGGDIYVRTVGWGTGDLGLLNTVFANDLWTAMDLLIAIYVDQNDDGDEDC